jgi:hypothetical protein
LDPVAKLHEYDFDFTAKVTLHDHTLKPVDIPVMTKAYSRGTC